MKNSSTAAGVTIAVALESGSPLIAILIENTQLKEKLKEKAEGAEPPTANEEG